MQKRIETSQNQNSLQATLINEENNQIPENIWLAENTNILEEMLKEGGNLPNKTEIDEEGKALFVKDVNEGNKEEVKSVLDIFNELEEIKSDELPTLEEMLKAICDITSVWSAEEANKIVFCFRNKIGQTTHLQLQHLVTQKFAKERTAQSTATTSEKNPEKNAILKIPDSVEFERDELDDGSEDEADDENPKVNEDEKPKISPQEERKNYVEIKKLLSNAENIERINELLPTLTNSEYFYDILHEMIKQQWPLVVHYIVLFDKKLSDEDVEKLLRQASRTIGSNCLTEPDGEEFTPSDWATSAKKSTQEILQKLIDEQQSRPPNEPIVARKLVSLSETDDDLQDPDGNVGMPPLVPEQRTQKSSRERPYSYNEEESWTWESSPNSTSAVDEGDQEKELLQMILADEKNKETVEVFLEAFVDVNKDERGKISLRKMLTNMAYQSKKWPDISALLLKYKKYLSEIDYKTIAGINPQKNSLESLASATLNTQSANSTTSENGIKPENVFWAYDPLTRKESWTPSSALALSPLEKRTFNAASHRFQRQSAPKQPETISCVLPHLSKQEALRSLKENLSSLQIERQDTTLIFRIESDSLFPGIELNQTFDSLRVLIHSEYFKKATLYLSEETIDLLQNDSDELRYSGKRLTVEFSSKDSAQHVCEILLKPEELSFDKFLDLAPVEETSTTSNENEIVFGQFQGYSYDPTAIGNFSKASNHCEKEAGDTSKPNQNSNCFKA